MNIEKRLDNLEQATQGRGTDGPQTVVKLSWGDPPIWIVDGEEMTKAEFIERWPNWEPDKEINLDWGDDDLSK